MSKYLCTSIFLVSISLIALNGCAGEDDEMLLLLPPGGTEEATGNGGPELSPDNAANTNGAEIATEEGTEVAVIIDESANEKTDPDTENTDTDSEVDATNTETGSKKDEADSGNDSDSGENSENGNSNGNASNTDAEEEVVADNSDDEDLDGDAFDEEADYDEDDDESGIVDSDDRTKTGNKCIKSVKLITKKGRWSSSTDPNDDSISGIHTYWQNEALKVKIKNRCGKRWVRLKVIARNIHGPLPDFYKHFNVEVRRGKKGKVLGAMQIPSSDTVYKDGSIYVKLRKNKNTFWLYWSNDAWSPGIYDANINIKEVRIEELGANWKPGKKMALAGKKQCYTQGRFFFDSKTAYTFWRNQTIGYCFNDLKPGLYLIKVRAKNYGKLGLPEGYEYFDINVAADGVSKNIKIKASDVKYRNADTILDLRGGDTIVNLTWTNDKWEPNVYDANIQYRRIVLQRVGDSTRTGLSAYIGQHGSNSIVLIASLLAALVALGGILYYRRRMETN